MPTSPGSGKSLAHLPWIRAMPTPLLAADRLSMGRLTPLGSFAHTVFILHPWEVVLEAGGPEVCGAAEWSSAEQGHTWRDFSHPGWGLHLLLRKQAVPWLTVAEGLHGAQQHTVGAHKPWFPLLVATPVPRPQPT